MSSTCTTDSDFVLQIHPHKYPTLLYDVPPLLRTPESEEIGMVFMIPGNPGLPQYYVPFLKLIRQQLPGWRVLCVSQAGCDTISTAFRYTDFSEQRYYSLDDQVVHKFEVLSEMLEKHKYLGLAGSNKRVVVIGHSVGCWLMQHLLVRIRNADMQITIKLAVLLFPTIRNIGESVSGVQFRKINSHLPKVANIAGSAVYYLNRYLPRSVVQSVVNVFMRFPPEHAVKATQALVASPSVVYQCVSLAAEEMNRITEEAEDVLSFFWDGLWGALLRDGSNTEQARIIAYFAREDPWVGNHTRAEIIRLHSSRANVDFIVSSTEDNCKHAFCVKDSEVMAAHVVQWIKEVYY
ncbi:hypothetical protein V1525DRAFT_426766 [Lipomyces kononenkoae]|uniref:Uncharacterized protein n=1 Tax=Lipomyces kononenkoae TaxID=34357 RepID=A0ACC3SYW0_LIPKO